jgi:carboxyl-terminal processing protease
MEKKYVINGKKQKLILLFFFLLINCSYSQPNLINGGNKNNFSRVCNDPLKFVSFFQKSSILGDLKEAFKIIPGSLEKRGIKVKQIQSPDKMRVGSKLFDFSGYDKWGHFEDKERRYWIDILEFGKPGTCNYFFANIKSSQIYSGSTMPDSWSFWTAEAHKDSNAISTIFRSNKFLFNFGLKIPFANDYECLLNSQQKSFISRSIDTLLIMMEDVSKCLVKTEYRDSVPKAFPDEKYIKLMQIESFMKLWSEIKYNFVFTETLKKIDWDNIPDKYLPRVQEAKTYGEYISILLECTALLKDGHTGIYFHNEGDTPPLQIQPVEGKPVITAYAKTEEMINNKIQIGMELIKVNGKPVEEILKNQIYPYICSSTPQDRDIQAFNKLLEFTPGEKVTAIFRNIEGKEFNTILTCNMRAKHDSTYWLRQQKQFEYKELDNNIIYIALNSFNNKGIVNQFDRIFDKILNSNGLILDIRKNGGGSSSIGYQIISKLIDKQLETSKWKTRQYKPAYKAWKKAEEWFESAHDTIQPDSGKLFLGKVVVLIGPKTFSAAEDFLVPLKASGRAKLIGMPTGGSTGQPLFVQLYETTLAICTKWDYFPDGTEFVGVGIQPDIKIEPTKKDIIENRDPVLEKAIQILNK